jgi:hypothetical protein
VVFRISSRRRIPLRLENLLAWQEFELVLPDLESAGQKYDLEIPRSQSGLTTRIEMPWGIELSPASDTKPSSFTFSDPPKFELLVRGRNFGRLRSNASSRTVLGPSRWRF